MIGVSSPVTAGHALKQYLTNQVAWALVFGVVFSLPVGAGLTRLSQRIAPRFTEDFRALARYTGALVELVCLLACLSSRPRGSLGEPTILSFISNSRLMNAPVAAEKFCKALRVALIAGFVVALWLPLLDSFFGLDAAPPAE